MKRAWLFALPALALSACATNQDWTSCSAEAERGLSAASGPQGLVLLDTAIRDCMEARGYVWRTDTASCRELSSNVFGTVDAKCFRRRISN